MLRRELALFDRDLAAKPQLVAANKIDAASDHDAVERLAARAAELGLPFHRISAVTGEGVSSLLEAAWPHVQAAIGRDETGNGTGRPAILTSDE